MKQHVLVLGASGFIGRRIVAALAQTQWARPVAASRNIAGAPLGAGIDKVTLDATSEADLKRALASADAVVSCIAGNAADIVASGQALFSVLLQAPCPPRVVYLSSIAAYGSARGIVEESSPLHGDLGDYSCAKARVEGMAVGASNVVRLRPGIVYGPESAWWSDNLARLLVCHRLGELGADGDGRCNAVHVDDVVTAVLRSVEMSSAGGEAFNLGSPEPPTWNEYLSSYARFLRATPVRPLSRVALLTELFVRSPALKAAEVLLRKSNPWAAQPAVRPWLLKLCRHDIRMDVRKAERQLRMQWRPLEAGLEQAAGWFLGRGAPWPPA